ncbi:thiamine-monophosphate kinase [Conyzicola lurida]|uniref:Thiamine-monophosphate kinase n=1 Tax=Conyzicola lurida TaxID=1172621 RepID=A0A841AL07_9MICO|nr:thiamine-phosphate kinase [Conyzicola lurida]MBB5843917.1 thiamine-monophosphate kinase [Conyzicola lurida]
MTQPDTLRGIGESATLARIFPRLPASDYALVGPGDDSAVMSAPDGRFVVTTDMMIHGPDFRLAWSTPHDLGWKAAASNLADVAAMGATPTALVVAIAAPADSPVSLLEGIADGLRDACLALAPGCGVVGGDLSVSDTLTIAVTAFGDLATRGPVLRSGARVGDVVAVSGVLGAAAAGLRLLFERAVVDGRPDAAAAAALRGTDAALVAAQLAPSPPISDGVLAAVAGATAMLDLSDGLALDARRLAAASGVALALSSVAVGSREALDGGEDHSLLATFPPGTALPGGFRQIGTVVAGEGVLVDGLHYEKRGGWDPYEQWSGQAG